MQRQMMKRTFRLCAVLLFLLLTQARSRADCACNDWQKAFEAQLQAVETERYKAMTGNDFPRLNVLLGDDLIYVHSSGVAQSKSDLIESMKSGALRYRNIQAQTASTRFYNQTTAILNGRATFEVTAKEKAQSRDLAMNLIFTAIYILRGEGLDRRWELVSWQSTNAPSKP